MKMRLESAQDWREPPSFMFVHLSVEIAGLPFERIGQQVRYARSPEVQ